MDGLLLAPTALYRGLLLFAAFLVPAFGVVYHVIAPADVDPWSLRLGFSAACLAVAFASWRGRWDEERMSRVVLAASYVVLAYMIGLSALNGYGGDRTAGILVTFFCVVLSFRRVGETLLYGAFAVIGSAAGYGWAPDPDISLPVLVGSLLSITFVIAVATESRRRMGLEIARSQRDLEQRVEERTRELARSMALLEREVVVRKRAETEATAASVAKSAFLANMSHELRTPLNAILGYTEILLEEARSLSLATFEEDLMRVRRAGVHLLAMIGEILDLAAIEAGKLQLETDRVPLAPLLQEVAETARPLMTLGSNAMTWRCPADLVARTDPSRLRQILLNLLSNAAKFTDAGRIDVSAWSEDDRVFVSVTDTGIGIAPDVLPTLFEDFTQVTGTARRFGGTGLGLSISRRLARALGGDVRVRSAPAAGSTFTVELPRAARTPVPEAARTQIGA